MGQGVVSAGNSPTPRKAAIARHPAPARTRHAPEPTFQAGDIILCATIGDLPSRLVGWAERSRGETPTYAVHAAQFLSANRILDMDYVARVKTRRRFLARGRGFEVWRKSGLSAADRAALSREARAYRDERFGWPKLLAAAADGLLGKLWPHPVYLARRLAQSDRDPLCSWITAFAYDRALHYRFGAPPECADPDQIHDWVRAHPDEWVRIYPPA